MTSHKPWRDLTDAEKRDLLSTEEIVAEVRPVPFGQLTRIERALLLLAHHEGKQIEYLAGGDGCWMEPIGRPSWTAHTVYRIAPEPPTPDSINWEHVSDEVNAIARDHNFQFAYCYGKVPNKMNWSWDGRCIGNVRCFSSYRRGTVDWKDSLVIRPGYEGS
jgi:hypothetical protein